MARLLSLLLSLGLAFLAGRYSAPQPPPRAIPGRGRPSRPPLEGERPEGEHAERLRRAAASDPAGIDLPITNLQPPTARVPLWAAGLALVLAFAGMLGVYLWLQELNEVRIVPPHNVVDGDADKGREAFIRYGCGGCHTIPGLPEARGTAGPRLGEFARDMFIAGRYENVPSNLIPWIMAPQELDPLSAMPSLGVSESHARDIAAYLYTLR